ncbi:MAG: hypothetical protein V3U35_03210 [Candidatus Neomarinimicrobiota bacterium]
MGRGCALLLLTLGCAATGVRPDPGVPAAGAAEAPVEDVIQVQYLGTAGYVFRRGRYALITAPLYSNPGLLRVVFGRIAPDTVLMHPPLPGIEVKAILIGHSHYDHLLDVPMIAADYHPQAVLYGSESARRILTVADPSLVARIKVLESELARSGQPGAWVYLADSSIRIMAIESDHGAHALRIHVMRGEVQPGLTRAPRSAWNWREGKTAAFVIDFLGPGGEINFRIHYQDAASRFPLGAPPDFTPGDTHRVDLAILSVGAWAEVRRYPAALLDHIRPRHVILGHWENFFRSPLKPPRQILATTQLWLLIPYIKRHMPADGDWLLPLPGAVYHFLPTTDGTP